MWWRKIAYFFIFQSLFAFSLQAQTLVVAGDDDFPPFSYIGEDGKLYGSDLDVLEELGRRTGIDFSVQLIPWKRLLLMTEQGKIDGSFSLFRTPERETYADFISPLHYSTVRLFTRDSQPIRYDDISDLYGRRIGVEAGFAVSPEFDLARQNGRIEVVEAFNYHSLFTRLKQGGLDGVAANEVAVRYQLSTKFVEVEFDMSEKPLTLARGAFFVLSKAAEIEEREAIVQKIKSALEELEEEGFMQKALEKYYGQNRPN